MSSFLRITAFALCPMFCLALRAQGSILAIDFDTGNLYGVNTSNASLSLIESTGVPKLGSLEYYDGTLYALRVGGSEAVLYHMAPDGSSIGKIGTGMGSGYYYEGGLTFAPDGTGYATNRGSSISPQLIKVDTNTGLASVVGTMNNGSHDINGLVWREDGMLVGVDRLTNAIVEINPYTAQVATLASLGGILAGGVGGMTVDGDMAYLATAGPGGTRSGSNSLYGVNLNTGAVAPIGMFNINGAPLTGTGISGLASVPEPSALAIMAVGALGFICRRRAA